MKTFSLMSVLLLGATCLGQESIPTGTILPVQLNSSLRSDKLRPGEAIKGRVMQDVPLENGSKIHAGAKADGKVASVKPATSTSRAEVAFRFDTLTEGKKRTPIATNLRAMANMMNVEEAQIPATGPDRGSPEYFWTTEQIGGETSYHGGGPVTHGSEVVGKSVANGVLVRVSSVAESGCRSEGSNSNRDQASWVFSSDACGLYGFPDLKIVHSGRKDPVGEIRIRSTKGDVNVRSGSGILLRVDDAGSTNPAD